MTSLSEPEKITLFIYNGSWLFEGGAVCLFVSS